jgi:hypothetical protein
MAVTHTSIVKRVLGNLDALPDDAPKKDVEAACAPLREMFQGLSSLSVDEARTRKKRIFGMPAYRQLARRHGTLIQEQL